MRSQDFHSFLNELDSETRAREFLVFILKWARAEPREFEVARGLPSPKAIELSKQLFPIYVLENLDLSNTTRH